jgi:hypothetical protein
MSESGMGLVFSKLSISKPSFSLKFSILFFLAFVALSGCGQSGNLKLQAFDSAGTEVNGAGDATQPACELDDGCKEDTGKDTFGKDPIQPPPEGQVASLVFSPSEQPRINPPLKLFFIVDNSVSMLNNQINLSNSFESLFSESGSSLKNFDAEIFIFTTAMLNSQYLSRFGNIPNYESISEMTQKYSYSELLAMREPSLTGQIPGDLMGYHVVNTVENGRSVKRGVPVPVHGLTQINGKPVLSPSILYKKGSSISELKAEFQSRVALLDPNKYATELDGYTGGESALCGMARILRDSTQFIKPGDHVSFVVVSDENESNPAGFRCVKEVSFNSNGEIVDFDYIAGTNSSGPALNLADYVRNRLSSILAQPALFSFFVRLEGDSLGDSGSTGTEYISFARSVGAQLSSILLNSFASALSQLSGIITDSVVNLTYELEVPADKSIKALYRKDSSGNWVAVPAAMWSTQGRLLILKKELNIKTEDQFKVEMY